MDDYPPSIVLEHKGLRIAFELEVNRETEMLMFEVVNVNISDIEEVIDVIDNTGKMIWSTITMMLIAKNWEVTKEINDYLKNAGIPTPPTRPRAPTSP